MADLAEVLSTYQALAGVAVGAGADVLVRRLEQAAPRGERRQDALVRNAAEGIRRISSNHFQFDLAHEAKHNKLRREERSQGQGCFRAWTGGRHYSSCWLVRSRGQSWATSSGR